MTRYIVIRLLNAVVVVIGVSLLVFVLTRAVGNPVDVMLPIEATQEERVRLAHQLGLDKPLLTQLWEYSAGVIRGDFGKSWWQGTPALELALERVPFSLTLSALAFIIAIVFAIPLGVLSALRPRSWLDKLTSTSAMLGICIPNFWLGLVLILIFANTLGWLPTSGTGSWEHWVLPSVALGVLPLGRITQIVRSAMMEQLRELYVVTARSKGLAEWVVVTKHALKNAGIPIITMSGWELGRMLAGYTVVIEVVFGLPGIGHLIIDAIDYQDFPLLQALTFVIAILINLLNLLIDLSYPLFNPRVKFE
jgi:peptide/nickel transport system permease protein